MSIEKLDLPDTNDKFSSSPERHTFQAENYIKRCEEEGTEPSEDYLNIYRSARQQDIDKMTDPKWQKNNLEYDLRTTDWILDKARAQQSYAQNIYAALCNMRWQRVDTWPILADQYWHCSWRYAGGIVADMLEKGDYIDWYCSGISNDYDPDLPGSRANGYVPESVVTEEIRKDFQILGWVPSEWPEDD